MERENRCDSIQTERDSRFAERKYILLHKYVPTAFYYSVAYRSFYTFAVSCIRLFQDAKIGSADATAHTSILGNENRAPYSPAGLETENPDIHAALFRDTCCLRMSETRSSHSDIIFYRHGQQIH
jgi:hypothetical protein